MTNQVITQEKLNQLVKKQWILEKEVKKLEELLLKERLIRLGKEAEELDAEGKLKLVRELIQKDFPRLAKKYKI